MKARGALEAIDAMARSTFEMCSLLHSNYDTWTRRGHALHVRKTRSTSMFEEAPCKNEPSIMPLSCT